MRITTVRITGVRRVRKQVRNIVPRVECLMNVRKTYWRSGDSSGGST